MSQNGFPVSGFGTIKNIQARGNTGKVFTANVSMRNDEGKCVVTMPLVFIEKPGLLAGLNEGDSISFTGRVTTRFDRRPGIDNALRGKPYTQIAVDTLENLALHVEA